jgi:uncharacterized BrkB/YihY/UPF0761 family membrane protein
MMFPINGYNNNYPLIGGGDFKNILPEMITYITLLVILVLEVTGPLTQEEAQKNLQDKQGLLYLFAAFTVMVPILIIVITWAYEGLHDKKTSKMYGYFGVITFFIVFQLVLTMAALIVSKPKMTTSELGYLYMKVILLFATMIGLSFTQMQIKSSKK